MVPPGAPFPGLKQMQGCTPQNTVEPAIPAGEAESLSADLDLLGHPIRLQLLGLLARSGGEVCVCDLEASVTVKQPTVSHHLRILREGGLVDSNRRGLWSYYFVNRERLEALRARISTGLANVAGTE
jgi:ArsR family transcriptional regulator, arsenate/arsenite/antimonite-responsive transcriptional repressor